MKQDNQPYKQCSYYELSRTELNKDRSYMITERRNREVEIKGCQDCNGYNIWCEIFKEQNER